MWIPTHIRPNLANSKCLLLTSLVSGVLLSGCASSPKFTSSPERIVNRSSQDIPVPVFDEPEANPASRIASIRPQRGIVAAPKPFAWSRLATSAGKRNIEGMTIGQGGYRTVIIGSLAGDDPLAIAFTEKLAKHIHENQIILGGIQATVVRNANPDGAALFRPTNENDVVLNRQFVSGADTSKDLLKQEPEVRFLMGLLTEGQPQRVIHIRSISRAQGIVASSSGAANVAKDVSGWLDFRFANLPGKSVPGTLERFLSQKDSCEIITFALPQSSKKEALWEEYGDSVLNLLLDEDYETRKLARQNRGTTAADSRGKKDRSLDDDGE